MLLAYRMWSLFTSGCERPTYFGFSISRDYFSSAVATPRESRTVHLTVWQTVLTRVNTVGLLEWYEAVFGGRFPHITSEVDHLATANSGQNEKIQVTFEQLMLTRRVLNRYRQNKR